MNHSHCRCDLCNGARRDEGRCPCDACLACQACKVEREVASRKSVVDSANANTVPHVERFWIVHRINDSAREIHVLNATYRHTSYQSAYTEMLRLACELGGTFAVFELRSAATTYRSVGIAVVDDPLPF